MNTILVPTDFSANALNAIQYASDMASVVKGKVILFHALHELIISTPEEPNAVQPGVLLQEGYLGELEKISRTIRLEHGFRFEVECICEPAPLYQTLSKLVVQHQVDLVVMGTKGASTFLDKLIGTNTRIVMEEVPCPVLAIPANVQFQGFNSITYASDFEKDEAPYLQQLLALAKPMAAVIQVLNIKTEEELDLVSDQQVVTDIEETLAGHAYQLTQVQADTVLKGVQAFQKKNHTEVLAVALEKRTFWEGFFHKSVSAELAYASTVPFLTLPALPYQQKKKNASATSQPGAFC
ncbi:universal stress protein [Rufibacter sp. LB8]|uniref:universal stress protein n=1 Tax=Rufibacter sp. LB8 TaxID=2777781 RepID=UPI00178C29D0|nr:universal stress protein [Rufibacter sp. LB8]